MLDPDAVTAEGWARMSAFLRFSVRLPDGRVGRLMIAYSSLPPEPRAQAQHIADLVNARIRQDGEKKTYRQLLSIRGAYF